MKEITLISFIFCIIIGISNLKDETQTYAYKIRESQSHHIALSEVTEKKQKSASKKLTLKISSVSSSLN